MIIKHADDRTGDIEALAALLERRDLTQAQRQAIQSDFWKHKAGAAGERSVAFEIDERLRDPKNYMVIHDLRVVHGEDTAQIDHLIVNRFCQVFVLETKSIKNGLRWNAQGEFETTVRFGGSFQKVGIPSPLHQNARHCRVLKRLFHDKVVDITRISTAFLQPDVRGLVVVPNHVHVDRRVPLQGAELVMKAEAIWDKILKDGEVGFLRFLGGTVSAASLEAFARALAARHTPLERDLLRRYGLAPVPQEAARGDAQARPPEQGMARPTASQAAPTSCDSCGVGIPPRVVTYCQTHAARFAGKTLCRICQGQAATP